MAAPPLLRFPSNELVIKLTREAFRALRADMKSIPQTKTANVADTSAMFRALKRFFADTLAIVSTVGGAGGVAVAVCAGGALEVIALATTVSVGVAFGVSATGATTGLVSTTGIGDAGVFSSTLGAGAGAGYGFGAGNYVGFGAATIRS